MNTQIELKRLQHFVLLAEERNFTRAAQRANLSQTAFSRSIQALEENFAVRVFDRGTRSVRLTPAGQQLVTKAGRLLAQARELAREVEDVASADGGDLSFGASLMAIDGVVNGVLPVLMRQRPRLRVGVEVSHWRLLQQHLEQDRIEFFVGYPGILAQSDEFAVTPLPTIASSIFCRAGHPLLAKGVQAHPHDLPRFPWATVRLREAADKHLRKLCGMSTDAPLPLALSCDSLPLLRESVLSSDMLLLTWSTWLRNDLQQGLIVDLGERLRPALPRKAMGLDCAIVRLAGRTASPAAHQLIELICGIRKETKPPAKAGRKGTAPR